VTVRDFAIIICAYIISCHVAITNLWPSLMQSPTDRKSNCEDQSQKKDDDVVASKECVKRVAATTRRTTTTTI